MIIKQSKYNRSEYKPIKINLDLMILNTLCRYVLQSSTVVRMEHLVNLRKMLSIIDYSTYENDHEKVRRYQFLSKVLEARLENKINDRNVILTYVNGGLTFELDFLDYDHLDLSKDEVIYIHKLVSETLQYQFLYSRLDDIQDICTRFKTADFMNRGNIVNEFEEIIDALKNDYRRTRVSDNSVDMTFSLTDGDFESAIADTYNLITNPSRRLITGMQGLNEMTGGGFESGRVYMLLGTSGIGKSITLLNLIYQIKRFNTNYKAKDPTKIPCIVLLTMENSVVETLTRLFDLVIDGSHGMENYTLDDVIYKLRAEGQLVLNDSSPINIIIKYKANKSVDTSYFYSLYDDLLDEGYEMICLVQDHVKRIRSISYNTDLRLELGDVVNEFKVFAIEKDIPIITNSHLNRDAAKILEDAARKSNQDVGKLLGKSNIGESMLMIDNLDMAIILALDFDSDENKYMTFNAVKVRTNSTRTYIAQPFARGSKIRLLEDVGGIPQFKESIHTAPEIKQRSVVKISGSSTMMMDNIADFKAIMEDDLNDNAFTVKNISLENGPSNLDMDKLNSISNSINNKPKVISPIEFMTTSETKIFLEKLTV